jgi:hypothetical protein
MSIPLTKNAYRTTYTNGQVKPSTCTSPPRKKSRIIFETPINDSKEDEEQTCSNDIGGRGGEELDATSTQGSIKEELEPKMDQIIDNIQI